MQKHTAIRSLKTETMMKQLSVKDNSSYAKEYFADIPRLTRKIDSKTLEQLEHEGVFVFPELVADAEDITKDQMILQRVGDCYRSQNVMGFIGYGDERLVLTSRFSDENSDFFLQYMLEQVLDFPNIVDLSTSADQDDRLFHMLLFLFPYYLKQAVRKGLFKTYIRRKYNDSNVKGIIDIPRHIDRNTPFVGKVAYNKREYSYDNYLMELIRHTIEFIKKKPYGKKILARVKNEVQLVVDATQDYALFDKRSIIEKNTRNVVRHAYYREYRSLQHLCLLILQQQKHNIGSGARQIYGILFDGAWLWEEYVNQLISDKFYHPRNKGREGAQRLFACGVGLIYPDFIGREQSPRLIADAKYKPTDNIGGKDYLQLLAYMLRFDAKTGYYLYPDSQSTGDVKLMLNEGVKYENNVKAREDICVIKHGLRIPDTANSYDDFVIAIKKSESAFRELFHSTT